MSDHEKHENHAGKRDDHFFANGGAVKPGESGHEANTVVFFNLAFNHDRHWDSEGHTMFRLLQYRGTCHNPQGYGLRYYRTATPFLWRNDAR